MSHSGLSECGGKWGPAISVLLELQAVSGGVGVHSTTENTPCQSVPGSGSPRDGGEREVLQGGGDEDLCLVVRGDQDSWNGEHQSSLSLI